MRHPMLDVEIKKQPNFDILYELKCKKLDGSGDEKCMYIDYDLAKKDFDELVGKCAYVILNKVIVYYDDNEFEIEELENYKREE